ncbi:MAG TPA: hypothetical protein VF681_06390 [Abditibacteriaceae bacterium]|jgi:hypothetical protein
MKLHFPLASLAATCFVATSYAAPQTIGVQGAMPIDKVEIASPHVYDYTFASAPTDWRVQSGVWEMTNRWACAPGWSWFGGRSDETAAVWNKRKFSGDMSVQFYFAFKMGLAGTPAWKYHPSDMGVTIGGDGQNMGSGYNFVVGADDNAHSILMRGGKVVAESSAPEALLPTYTDGEPDNGHKEYEQLHRRWWYVRIDKIGSKVSCYLDNKLLFSYDDPKPLDAGHIALWTYNNGIMLSRVQVYYENEVRPQFVRRATKLADAPKAPAAAKPSSKVPGVKIARTP